jgi:phosphoribosylanthranilate isomerase
MKYVKVCGLKNYEAIRICEQYGADAVGFIYNVPQSPRNLDKITINKLVEKIHNGLLTVGVSKPQDVLELTNFYDNVHTDYYQIHSTFSKAEINDIPEQVKKKTILAFKLDILNIKEIINKINQFSEQFFGFLIDNSEGHGKNLDLSLVSKVLESTRETRIILAGGISIENIEEIMIDLDPYGIDVSSSLESKIGEKDPLKIKHFLEKINELKRITEGE